MVYSILIACSPGHSGLQASPIFSYPLTPFECCGVRQDVRTCHLKRGMCRARLQLQPPDICNAFVGRRTLGVVAVVNSYPHLPINHLIIFLLPCRTTATEGAEAQNVTRPQPSWAAGCCSHPVLEPAPDALFSPVLKPRAGCGCPSM